MTEKPDPSYVLFGVDALLKRSQALIQEMDGVRKAEDIECVHRMRVASRRLRAALALFEDCLPRKRAAAWRSQVRRVTRALGAARDADVQKEFVQGFLSNDCPARFRPGIERLLLRLSQKRDSLQPLVVACLHDLEHDGTMDSMQETLRQTLVHARADRTEVRTPYTYRRAVVATELRLEELLSFEPHIRQPERVAELHGMRIAAKRLRYTMEVFAPLYNGALKEPIGVVRDLQEVLGEVHDCDVWVEQLPQFLEEERQRTEAYFGHARAIRRLAPGILHLRQDRQAHRERSYRRFLEKWDGTRAQGTWEALRRALEAPLDRPSAPKAAVGEEAAA